VELRQLEYLAAVVSHGSFGRAAQEIYVTQSALSQQIARLEDELGLTLLVRGPKGVEPTPAGVEFLDHARAILGRVTEARAAVDDHLGAVRGVARVAATPYDTRELPEALASFHRTHPQVQLAFQQASAAQIVEQLATGAIDVAMLAVSDDGAKLPGSVVVHTLAQEPLCLLAGSDDPLVEGGSVGDDRAGPGPTIDDLRGRPVIMPTRGTALRALLDGAFADVGFSPLPRFETSDPQMIRQLVSAGLGVSIIPRGWLLDSGPAVAAAQLAQPLPAYRIALLATTQPRIPARDRLVEHLRVALVRPSASTASPQRPSPG
jgi:LysR family nitrogen assimilation transcriptional regulator